MNTYSHALLGLFAQTPIHAGSGEADSIIDLPIQREAHTDWPCIYGSGVKGALRARAEVVFGADNDSVYRVFGPDTDRASEHAGALMVSDARLLMLPVRSLNSHYRLVTCPAALRRLQRDLQRLQLKETDIDIPAPGGGEAIVHGDEANHIPNATDALFLEEYRFTRQIQPLTSVVELVTRVAGESRRDDISRLFTLVDDNAFRHLCRSATPVQTHIRLNSETKTVSEGALWNEESLPTDTLLYSTLSATTSRDYTRLPAQDVLSCVLDELFGEYPFLRLGGNETTGMGWCRVTDWRTPS